MEVDDETGDGVADVYEDETVEDMEVVAELWLGEDMVILPLGVLWMAKCEKDDWQDFDCVPAMH